jgi:hypothetical protein
MFSRLYVELAVITAISEQPGYSSIFKFEDRIVCKYKKLIYFDSSKHSRFPSRSSLYE